MLQSPEDWDSETDLDGFLASKLRLRLFLDVLQLREDEKVADGTLFDSQRLAVRMESFVESGTFWVCLAACLMIFTGTFWTKYIMGL